LVAGAGYGVYLTALPSIKVADCKDSRTQLQAVDNVPSTKRGKHGEKLRTVQG
jgi:hypothetical protein